MKITRLSWAVLEANYDWTIVRIDAAGGKPVTVTLATVRGEDLRISAMVDINGRTLRHDFTGRVRGDTVEGTLRLFDKVESSASWSAVRTGGKGASIDPSAGVR